MTPSPSEDGIIYSWYSYGVMYGWYTATAENGNYDMASGNVAGDICPAGWRLPTGGGSGEYVSLTNAVSGENNMAKNNNLLAFPNNFGLIDILCCFTPLFFQRRKFVRTEFSVPF